MTDQQTGTNAGGGKAEYYIVEVSALPEVILKVIEAKKLIESGKEKTIQGAAAAAGISRSAFYKYRDSVFPFYENTRGKTFTISIDLDNVPGALSTVLNMVADFGANVLTINQTIPLNNVASVSLTVETGRMIEDPSRLVSALGVITGVYGIKIISRE